MRRRASHGQLAYLLTEYGARCEFLSASVEAPSPRRRALPFYAASLAADGARVGALLAAAPAEGVRVRQCSLSANELWNTLRDGEHVVICLVDCRVLSSWAQQPAASPASPIASPSAGRGFFGHYVLLVGLDDGTDSIVLKDPASAHEEVRVPTAQLERARRCRGTDEDLLLIPLDQEEAPRAPPLATTSKIQAVLSR
jgi:hypothetical protein